MRYSPEELTKPLTDEEIEWRVQQSGFGSNGKPWAKLVPYIDSRAVMERFDNAFGNDGWNDSYEPVSLGEHHGFICTVNYCCDSGSGWSSKSDASNITDIESIKGGISGALKRVAVKMGMGRELYQMKDIWASNIQEGYPKDGGILIQIKDKDNPKKKHNYWCYPPKLNDKSNQPQENPQPPQENPQGNGERDKLLTKIEIAMAHLKNNKGFTQYGVDELLKKHLTTDLEVAPIKELNALIDEMRSIAKSS